jgi:site-specific recombinase XerD
MERVRQALRLRHYSARTELAYVRWIRRFIRFHCNRHPAELRADDVASFLSSLAASAATQNQALAAVLFLYRTVLDTPVGWVSGLVHAQRPRHMPCVLTRDEVRSVLRLVRGVERLVVGMLYGSGLRLLEALSLRCKDVDFERGEVVVRRGKGAKDRITILADAQRLPLRRYLERLRERFDKGAVSVELPDALRKRSTPTQSASGRGNGCSRAVGDDITCIRRRCSARSAPPFRRVASASQPPAIRCATRSPLTCSRRGMTSAPSKSCLGTGMCGQQ